VAAPAQAAPSGGSIVSADVVVYGGTSAGVIAAVQAKRMGKSALIVCPDKHLGGLSSGGLGWTDTGDKSVIGGLAREFYHRVWTHYDRPEAWTWQRREEYGNKGQGAPAIDGDQRTMWIFEPHVAEQVFEDLVREHEIPVYRDEWLDRARGVKKDGARLLSITMLSNRTVEGKMFLDATYEGDLMAAAGVSYTVGREAQSVYDERWNGVQTGVLHHQHHFGVLKQPISPYVVPGDPTSGVLPRISIEPPGEYGQGDQRVQAYCFRMCLTDHPDNRVPFSPPEGYDPAQYELLLRIFEAGWRDTFQKFDPIPNRKTDTNNHGPFSTDNIGFNYDYPEASYERRREIVREHETYQKGWLYFIANDPRVPADVRQAMSRWGLARDEFTDNGHWPHQLYIREARRMIGQFVMTENELLKRRPTPDSVGMGSYTIDSHNVRRYITPEGFVQNEGDIGVPTQGPYQIAYGALVPRRGQADNLLVPVCVSSSHIAFGSIRMEPVFMILGQSAATAAVLALDSGTAVQDVRYAQLRERLLRDGQVLQRPRPDPPRGAPNAAATKVPRFGRFETTLQHTNDVRHPYKDLAATARITHPDLPEPWEIPLFWDGGRDWKLRFSPDRIGTWSWEVRSPDPGLDGQTGRILVVPSDRRGGLRARKDFPYHFERQDGTPFWFLGDTGWALFQSRAEENLDRERVRHHIDTRAAQGFNVIHAMLMSEAGWGNEGGEPFLDLSREQIHPPYWREVDRRLAELNDRGLVGGLVLAWADKGRNPGNWRDFPSQEARERYARYVAARYGAFDVYFIVGGEWNLELPRSGLSRDDLKRQYLALGRTVAAADPHDRMIGIHPGGDAGVDEFAKEPWMAFGDYQQVYRDLHGAILKARRHDKPVVNSEYAYFLRDQNGDGVVDKPNSATADAIRHATWDILMAGGYVVTGFGSTYFGGNRHPTPFDVDTEANDPWEAQVQHARSLFTSLEWWRLVPYDHAVQSEVLRDDDRSRGSRRGEPPARTTWALADPARCYLVYGRGLDQPITLNLPDDASGRYRLRQFNPRTGHEEDLGLRTQSGSLRLVPPDPLDWAWVLTRE
jgi:hypothetical protein